MGEFDHHQEGDGREKTCAASLVYEWLVKQGRISQQEALLRIVRVVNQIDHFENYFWAEPAEDRYDFFLDEVLHGVRMADGVRNDEDLLKLGFVMLDGVLALFKTKVAAEAEINAGIVFSTKWGKAVGVESGNNGIEKLALKMGYDLVIRKDLETGSVRIKAAPLKEIDLSPLEKKLREADAQASWYFHPSGKMILNGSIRDPGMTPSELDLSEIIKLIKSL